MWIIELVCYLVVWSYLLSSVTAHLPSDATTPSSKVDQLCYLADSCIHDTIPVCGRMGEKTKTFLDLCDLLEYCCDSNLIYVHIDDMKGCPDPEQIGKI